MKAVVMNKVSLALAALVILGGTQAAFASPNIVADPGFELNNGSWTLTGFDINADASHSGTNEATTACVGATCTSTLGSGAFIQQNLATAAGTSYSLSFYVAEDYGPTSEVSVFWNGALVADVLNPANSSLPNYVLLAFDGLVATSGTTSLEVHGRQDPASLFLDDFSVTAAAATAVPEPASLALVGMGVLGLRGLRRKRG